MTSQERPATPAVPWPLRWGALAVMSPLPMWVGGSLLQYSLGLTQVLIALTVGTLLGVLGLALVWVAPPGAFGAALGRRVWILPVGLWLGGWAIFSVLEFSSGLAWLVPATQSPAGGISPVGVGITGLVLTILVAAQWRWPGFATALAALTAAAWMVILPRVFAMVSIVGSAARVQIGVQVSPATAAYIYLLRMGNLAGLALAVTLMAVPLAGGAIRPQKATRRRAWGQAAAVGAVLLLFMLVGIHVGDEDGLMFGLPAAWRWVAWIALMGGGGLWAATALRTLSGQRPQPVPGWLWALLAVGATGAAALAGPGYDTGPVVRAEWLLLAVPYLLAPWLGVLLAQRVRGWGRRTLGNPGSGWAVAAWMGGVLASLPGIRGFGVFGGGPLLTSLLPAWRYMSLRHPQVDWALPTGFVAAYVIYTAARACGPGVARRRSEPNVPPPESA